MNRILVLLILLTGLFPFSASAEEIRIVAVVNDDVITQSELNQAMAPFYLQLQAASDDPEEIAEKMEAVKGDVLQQLIEERLMLQEALEPSPREFGKGKIGTPYPVEVSEEEVEEMVEETRQRFETEQLFIDALTRQGLTLGQLRQRYQNQLIVDKLVSREVKSRVSVSPSEATAFYEAHKEDFSVPQAAQVSTILIRSKDSLDLLRARSLANDLRRRAAGGEDFADLARRFSDGPNADKGGRAGVLQKGKTIEAIDQVIFSLKAGEISPVIKTDVGFHIFRVESTRPGRQATLEEVQGAVRNELFRRKTAQRYNEWIVKLREDAYISIK